jgi:hypothetical protein
MTGGPLKDCYVPIDSTTTLGSRYSILETSFVPVSILEHLSRLTLRSLGFITFDFVSGKSDGAHSLEIVMRARSTVIGL